MVRQRLSLRAKALALLAGREYSRIELSRKLRAYAGRAERDAGAEDISSDEIVVAREIETLLDEFTERGWLSEARYVEQTVNRLSRRYGPRRVMHSLESKGVGRESAEAILPYLQSEALTTAKALLARKFRGCIQSAEDRARRVRFLQARGFDYDVIKKALVEPQDDPLTDLETGR